MALIVPGKTTCGICDAPLTEQDPIVAFPAFLPHEHPLGRFSDAAFHSTCFEADPASERVRRLYQRYRAIWDARPRDLKTLAEFEAWERKAFEDLLCEDAVDGSESVGAPSAGDADLAPWACSASWVPRL